MLQIVIVAWLLLFMVFAVYKITNAPKLCWDSERENPVTHKMELFGGCDSQYGQTIQKMILPFTIWLIILAILLAFYFKSKK